MHSFILWDVVRQEQELRVRRAEWRTQMLGQACRRVRRLPLVPREHTRAATERNKVEGLTGTAQSCSASR
jgi:hypothetical protein